MKLKQGSQISCALCKRTAQSESRKYCCVTGPCQQDDTFWAELPTCSVGRLTMRGWKRGRKSSLAFASVVSQPCISSPGQPVPFLQGAFVCSHSFHPQQSLAQAVPLLLHLLNKKVEHPSAYMLLGRKSCHSPPAPYLSPGRAWSVFSSLHPQKQHTPALLPFTKYSLPQRSEHLKDASFPSLCLVPT